MNKCLILFLTMMIFNVSFLHAGKKYKQPKIWNACDYNSARPTDKKENRALNRDYSAHQPRKTPQSRFVGK